MIKTINASVAKIAMSAPRSSNYFTLRAKAIRLKLVKKFQKVKLRILLDKTRIF
jgi:hypothetical protein